MKERKEKKKRGGGARVWKENPGLACFPTIPSRQLSGLVLSPGPQVKDVRSDIALDSTVRPFLLPQFIPSTNSH